MGSVFISLVITSALFSLTISEGNVNNNGQLSRRKRYVVFPEGSSFSVALCVTIQALAPGEIFTEGLNWGIAYDLPNDTRDGIRALYTKPRPVLMRRRRSDLYQKLELILDSAGFNGRTCLYRTLCESVQRLTKGKNLIDELFRVIFQFPLEKIMRNEPGHHHMYQWAHRMGHEQNNCEILFPGCSISLLDMAYGGDETTAG